MVLQNEVVLALSGLQIWVVDSLSVLQKAVAKVPWALVCDLELDLFALQIDLDEGLLILQNDKVVDILALQTEVVEGLLSVL